MSPVNEDRLKALQDVPILRGGHTPPTGPRIEACVMEMVAYVAGEPWSDHPECACPVISSFARRWNDAINDTDREILRPLIPRLVGTRSTPEVEGIREWMALDWMVREYTPAWLRLAGLTEHAEAVEHLAALTNTAAATASNSALAAAGAAAWAAAGDAAGAAAWAAAGAAAGAAAWAAAGAAAWDAAGAAAWAAAGDAEGDALAPTVKALQVSALALIDRMIAAGIGVE